MTTERARYAALAEESARHAADEAHWAIEWIGNAGSLAYDLGEAEMHLSRALTDLKRAREQVQMAAGR